jgi:hypothetical protein
MRQGVHLPQPSAAQNSNAKRALSTVNTAAAESASAI